MKDGYYWAKTPAGDLFIILSVDGRGFVPAMENAIALEAFNIIEPVQWPSQDTAASRVSAPPKLGAPAAVAAPASSTPACAASA